MLSGFTRKHGCCSRQGAIVTNDRQWLVVYLGIAALFASLFVIFPLPPFMDYPVHLLESQVIAHPEKFAPYYHIDYQLIPNITTQVVLGFAAKFLDVCLAGRIFYIVVLLAYALGAYLFARGFMDGRYWAGLAFFLLLSNFFFWRGYMNFVLSVSLLLLFLHLNLRRNGPLDVLLALVTVAVLFVTHFHAPAILLLYRACRDIMKRELRAGTFLGAGLFVVMLAVYHANVAGEAWGLNFEGPYWKLALLKRISGIPYLALLSNPLLFTWINFYNAVIYITTVAILVMMAIKAPTIIGNRTAGASFMLFFLCLGAAYLAAPATVGHDIDNRIGFFLLLFAFPLAFDRVLLKPKSRPALRFFLVGMIYLSFMISFGQFHNAHDRMTELYLQARQKQGPLLEPIVIDQQFRVQEVAQKSTLFRILEKVRIHTDLTQVVLSEEHAESYFYLGGGFPRRLFITSIVKSEPRYRPPRKARP